MWKRYLHGVIHESIMLSLAEGTETLICFHGYGQDCTVFNVFEQSLGKKYRLVSVDLPFQGKQFGGKGES